MYLPYQSVFIELKTFKAHLIRAFYFLLFLCISSETSADLYKYIDDNGVPVLTNQLESVPPKYRSSMKVVKEEASPPRKMLLPEVQKITADPPPAAPSRMQQNVIQKEAAGITAEKRKKIVNSGLVISGLVAGYFILSKLTGSLGIPRMGLIAFLLVTLIGGVYLYRLYLNEMSSVFTSLRKDALGIKKNVETREVKSDEMLKKLPLAE